MSELVGKDGKKSAGVSASLRATPEERRALFASLTPFDCAEWRRTVGPSTPEDIAMVEQFLQDRVELPLITYNACDYIGVPELTVITEPDLSR